LTKIYPVLQVKAMRAVVQVAVLELQDTQAWVDTWKNDPDEQTVIWVKVQEE
jgi:hypothetical protein